MLKDFKTLKSYFIRNRPALIAGILSLLLVDFLQLSIPRIIKRAVDSLTLARANNWLLLKYALAIVAIAAAMAIFRYIWRYFLFGHSRKIEKALRNRIYKHLQTLPLSFYWRNTTGDLMARVVNDVDAVRMATGMGLVALTDGILLGLATIGFMLYIDVQLTLISLIPAPFIIIFTRIITRKMGWQFRNIQRTFSGLTETAREAISGIRVIKSYNRENWQYSRLRENGETYIKDNMDLAKTLALFFPAMTLFTNLGLAVVIWIGGRLTILGDITTGDFVAFISYLNLLTWPMMALGWVLNLIQRASASMGRINSILNENPETPARAPGILKSSLRGEIRIKEMLFQYPGSETPCLQGINISIRDGQAVAVVGGVGSGKSTFLQTIPRLLETKKGMVSVDGRAIHDIDLAHLRGSIGFATQESQIFSDTLLNNIVFGREVSGDIIDRVLEVSQLSADMDYLHRGLHSFLGEKGVTLSGGQSQRVGIARALVANPPILILDDALSQVDTITEARILTNILNFRREKTNIIVSHRLSSIKRADNIHVFKEGGLAESGIHNSLINAGGEYARLYERQQLSQALGGDSDAF